MYLLAVCSPLVLALLVPEIPAVSDASEEWIAAVRRIEVQLKQGSLSEAAESAKHALGIAKRSGPAGTRVAAAHHLLARIYREQGLCVEARSNYARAIAIWTRQEVPNRRHIFNAIVGMINVLCECDAFDAADRVFRNYREELTHYGGDTRDQVTLLSLRGALSHNRKHNAEAEGYFRLAIDLMQGMAEIPVADVAAERANLAFVLIEERRYAEALAQAELAVGALEQAKEPHPSLVAGLNGIAIALVGLGRIEESERALRRTLTLSMDLYGENSRMTAVTMLNYAGSLRRAGKAELAGDWERRGKQLYQRSMGRGAGTVDIEELRAMGASRTGRD